MLMQKPGRVLQDNQIDFRYVPADVFAERDFYRTEITDKLSVNGHEHAVLVIPYTQFITRETAEAVIELAGQGGKVLFLEAYPDGLCSGEGLPDFCPFSTLDAEGFKGETGMAGFWDNDPELLAAACASDAGSTFSRHPPLWMKGPAVAAQLFC